MSKALTPPEQAKDQPPNRIFLQYYGMDADDMRAEYGDEWCEAHETTYCVDQQYDTDIEYRRSDIPWLPPEVMIKKYGGHSIAEVVDLLDLTLRAYDISQHTSHDEIRSIVLRAHGALRDILNAVKEGE